MVRHSITTGLLVVGSTTTAAFVNRGIARGAAVGSFQNPASDVCNVRARDSDVAPLQVVGDTFSLESLKNLFGGVRESKTTLPQDPDADQEERKKYLAAKQETYRWSTEGIPVGTPYLEGFPPNEELPSVGWITKIVPEVIKIFVGTVKGTVGATEIVEALSSPERAETFVQRLRGIISSSRELDERPVDINDYEDLHQFPLRAPESVVDYEDDDAFARLRLQGANCVAIEKCSDATRKKLRALDEDPEYKELKDKVDSLKAAGKLFVVDHDLLKDMEADPLDGKVERWLCPSVALFEMTDDDLLPIKPIAIQASQGKEVTPIFTPEDGYNWAIAKACFEAADFIIHEVVHHLGTTHIVLEAPMVAMNRQLHENHPVYRLLKPHLEGTAFINWGAQDLLIVPGAAVDRLQANKIEDTWDLALQEVLKHIAKDFSPPEDLKARGMTEQDFPGRYPYRDYGLMYWDAILTWTTDYLQLFYETEEDLTGDYELQAFIDEMINIGQFAWLKEYQDSSDKLALITKILASFIYTASTLHAAVNFPQRPSMSFSPSCPGSVYVAPPMDKKERTFQDYLDYLPPLEIATTAAVILTLLGSVFYTRLGDYDVDQFNDDRVPDLLAKFQQKLQDIETHIEEKNAYVVSGWRSRGKDKREAVNFSYRTLLPDNVPQSTNI